MPTKENTYYSRTSKEAVLVPDSVWKQILSPEVYAVAREKGTERPFTSAFETSKAIGTYYCKACGNPLFKSDTKFDSGCGWPSFYEPLTKKSIIYTPDNSHGMKRTEVQCGKCKAHLGHVFEDGPPPTGLRYCINGVILDFELTPANEYDLEIGIELLSEHTDLQVLGDKAYISAAKAAHLWNENHIELKTTPRRNQQKQLPRDTQWLFNSVRQIIVSAPDPGTNAGTNVVLAALSFGSTNAGNIYVRRADENPVYAVPVGDFQKLPAAAWQMHTRPVWNFAASDVTSIIVQQGDRRRELLHEGTNAWVLAKGSSGILDGVRKAAIEETAHRFGELAATVWTGRGEENRARLGFSTNGLGLTFELKTGAKHQIEFGGLSPEKYPYAAVKLDGQTWFFEASRALYELASFYPQMGDVLKKKFAGWRAYIFTADLRLPKLIGLSPSKAC